MLHRKNANKYKLQGGGSLPVEDEMMLFGGEESTAFHVLIEVFHVSNLLFYSPAHPDLEKLPTSFLKMANRTESFIDNADDFFCLLSLTYKKLLNPKKQRVFSLDGKTDLIQWNQEKYDENDVWTAKICGKTVSYMLANDSVEHLKKDALELRITVDSWTTILIYVKPGKKFDTTLTLYEAFTHQAIYNQTNEVTKLWSNGKSSFIIYKKGSTDYREVSKDFLVKDLFEDGVQTTVVHLCQVMRFLKHPETENISDSAFIVKSTNPMADLSKPDHPLSIDCFFKVDPSWRLEIIMKIINTYVSRLQGDTILARLPSKNHMQIKISEKLQ